MAIQIGPVLPIAFAAAAAGPTLAPDPEWRAPVDSRHSLALPPMPTCPPVASERPTGRLIASAWERSSGAFLLFHSARGRPLGRLSMPASVGILLPCGSRVLAWCANGELLCVEPGGAGLVWRLGGEAMPRQGRALRHGARVAIVGLEKTVMVDADEGRRLWTTAGAALPGTATFDGELVCYVTPADGARPDRTPTTVPRRSDLVALDAASGRVRWKVAAISRGATHTSQISPRLDCVVSLPHAIATVAPGGTGDPMGLEYHDRRTGAEAAPFRPRDMPLDGGCRIMTRRAVRHGDMLTLVELRTRGGPELAGMWAHRFDLSSRRYLGRNRVAPYPPFPSLHWLDCGDRRLLAVSAMIGDAESTRLFDISTGELWGAIPRTNLTHIGVYLGLAGPESVVRVGMLDGSTALAGYAAPL